MIIKDVIIDAINIEKNLKSYYIALNDIYITKWL
jgi:hypothetical protein